MLRERRHDDRGSALIITMMVIVLVTGLATTVSVLTINNLQSSWRAQQAGAALNAADAGVTRALTYLRSKGVAGLTCDTGPCPHKPASTETPLLTETHLPSTSGQSFQVWVQAVDPFTGSNVGTYTIWSLGRAAGEAQRLVQTDVTVTASDVPRGIFAKSLTGNGAATVNHESVFSTGCVWNRDKVGPSATDFDLAYGIPAGVHTSGYVTTAHGSGDGCSKNDSVHKSATCNSAYPFDQDLAGGPFLADSDCEKKYNTVMAAQTPAGTVPFATYFSVGSKIASTDDLANLFKMATNVPSDAQKDLLRTMALSQGNFSRSASQCSGTSKPPTCWKVPDENNAVLYFDLDTAGSDDRTVDLNAFQGSLFDPTTWPAATDDVEVPGEPDCQARSLVIVVDGGNVQMGKNTQLAAAMFLRPDSNYGQVLKSAGTAQFYGTIYARTINIFGTLDLRMSKCFLLNTSPALLDVQVDRYSEVDNGLS